GVTCHDDFDECNLGDPCHHRGSCLNTIGSYRCKCFDGWLGEDEHCGKIDNSTSFRKCATGYMGEWCEDLCLTNSSCRQNGVCQKRGRGLRCICSPGWIGRNCTTDVNECSRNPCKNTAMTCINIPGSFDCQCFKGWEGINCDSDINECKSSAGITYTIVGSAILIILLVCSIATLAGIQTYKSNHRQVDTEVIELTMEKKQMQLKIFNRRYNYQRQEPHNHKENLKDYTHRMREHQTTKDMGRKEIELDENLDLENFNAKSRHEDSQGNHDHGHHVRNMEQVESRPHINDHQLCQEHVNLQYDYYKKTEFSQKKKKRRSRPIWQY
ncbi:protein jagged-1b-like, partial [Ruditapes philippinarum]|uniref:protein jagged-1b-like n=1 Tax=Ruditapes philippinarum TaxID=129788 RepID=UPI00295AC459